MVLLADQVSRSGAGLGVLTEKEIDARLRRLLDEHPVPVEEALAAALRPLLLSVPDGDAPLGPMPGEDAAAAAFRGAREREPRTPCTARAGGWARVVRPGLGLAMAASMVGGVAAAGATGVLPSPSPFSITHPAEGRKAAEPEPEPEPETGPGDGSQETGQGVVESVAGLLTAVAALLAGIGGLYGGRAAWGTSQDARAERDRNRPDPPPVDPASHPEPQPDNGPADPSARGDGYL